MDNKYNILNDMLECWYGIIYVIISHITNILYKIITCMITQASSNNFVIVKNIY